MADKKTLNIVSGVEKEKKDGSKYYIYKDGEGVEYLSKTKYGEGSDEFFYTEQHGEYNGKPTAARWITKEEFKKGGQNFPPKKPDQVAMFKEAMVLVSEYINLGLISKPKTIEELRTAILKEFEWIKGTVK